MGHLFFAKLFGYSELRFIFAVRKGGAIAHHDSYWKVTGNFSGNNKVGAIAQSVEQWTENPCVPGSIPGGTTHEPDNQMITEIWNKK